MAERLELGAERYSGPNMGLAEDLLFQPGTVQGSLQKGDELNPYYQGADELVSGGSNQYGLTAWDDLWGSGGQLLDSDAFLRSMNAASVFGQAPMTLGDAQRSPYLGANQQGGLDYGDLGTAYWGAGRSALDAGADQSLVSWLQGINDFGATPNDPRERFFDPNSLTLGAGDFGGMDLANATQDDLNAWAQENYGIDLVGLAGMGTGLAGARNEFMQDPNTLWNEQTGSFDTLSLPGIQDEEAAARMSAYETALANLQSQNVQQRSMDYSDQFNSALMSNPEMMRTGAGQWLGGGGAQALGLQQLAGQRIQGPTDYSTLFQYGLAPDLANQALSQLGIQTGGY